MFSVEGNFEIPIKFGFRFGLEIGLSKYFWRDMTDVPGRNGAKYLQFIESVIAKSEFLKKFNLNADLFERCNIAYL